MQPSRYPVDWNWLSAVWCQFVTTGVLDPSLDPIVAMSWQAVHYATIPALPPIFRLYRQWSSKTDEINWLT